MMGFEPGFRKLLFCLGVLVLPLAAQQSIPDAPKPKNPQPQFPAGTAPAPKNEHPEIPAPAAEPTPPATAAPSAPSKGGIATSRNDLYTYGVRVNFVQVPVT